MAYSLTLPENQEVPDIPLPEIVEVIPALPAAAAPQAIPPQAVITPYQ